MKEYKCLYCGLEFIIKNPEKAEFQINCPSCEGDCELKTNNIIENVGK